jgi:hypothetical protein
MKEQLFEIQKLIRIFISVLILVNIIIVLYFEFLNNFLVEFTNLKYWVFCY